MNLPETLAETYLYQAAQSVVLGEASLTDASAKLIAGMEWGNPSDGEINRVDTLIQDLIRSQQAPQAAYILAELNLVVCQTVGSPSQEVICADAVGEAITRLKDPRLVPRRIEVYQAALEIVEQQSDYWRAAILYNNLGNAYSELTTGDLQANSQTAIDYFEQALLTFTCEVQPYAWACIQNNLAAIYKVIPSRDDAYIRFAIAAWNRALTVFTRDVYPLEWANARRNLGIACKDLNSGNRVENLSLAKNHLTAALQVFNPEQQPSEWAETLSSLGNVYANLTTGDRSKNLRQAIACFEETLSIRTSKTFPAPFAAICTNLGIAWFSLPDGDHAENLRRAIGYWEQALSVYTFQDFPELTAQVHANLAAAYLRLPTGDRAQNLRRADHSLALALNVFTLSNNPPRYAWVKTTQGAVYQAMARTDPRLVRSAIQYFQDALAVYTAEAFPADYARVMDALGTLYRSLTDGDQQANHRRAEQCYQAALMIYQSEIFPDDFASTQTNLGNCYLFWPTPDRSQTLPKAIECYQRALSIHTREAFPLDYARLMDGLAITYGLLANERHDFQIAAARCFQEALNAAMAVGVRSEIVRIAGNAGSLAWKHRDWSSAYSSLATAIRTLEEIWGEHYSPVGKSDLQIEYTVLYSQMVQSCHALAREKDALDYAERSRSRYLLSLLGETLELAVVASTSAREQLDRLSALSRDLRSLSAVIQQSSSAEQTLAFIDHEETLRQEGNRLLEDLADELPEYVALRKGYPQDFELIKEMLATP